MARIEVRAVSTAAELNQFIALPWKLYRKDAAWIPPLKADVRELFDRRKNPYFGHAQAQAFIALHNGAVVGRISAQVCELVQAHMGQGTGQWGFFECVDDEEAARALFDAAEAWLRVKGMTRSLGPFNLSVWDDVGLLIEGFQHPARMLTGHALPYYQTLIEKMGYAKVRDMYAYDLDITKNFPDGILRIVAAGERNSKIKLRKPDMKNLDAEVERVLDILNDAWSDNWGFVPFTEAEKKYAAKKMKPIVRADFVRFCEYDGELAGFMWTIPDLNPTIAKLNGNLFPFGFLRLLMALRRDVWPQLRVPLMGIKKKFQSGRQGGLMVMMMIEHIRRDAVANYGGERGELGWILDNNDAMNNILVSIGCKKYKTYRVFETTL